MQEYFDRLKNDFRSLGNKKSIATLVVVLLLILLIPLGINLLKQTLTYFSRAGGGPPVELLEGRCVVNKGNKTIKCNEIPLKLTSPLGPPAIIPSVPKNLRIESNVCEGGTSTGSRITLKWDRVEGAQGYNVVRRLADTGQVLEIISIAPSANVYSDLPARSSIQAGTRIKYTVIAGVDLQSEPSNEVEATVLNCNGSTPTPSPSPAGTLTVACRIYGRNTAIASVGEEVRWQVNAEGGVKPYQISWGGEDPQLHAIGDANLDLISVAFTTPGIKSPDVRVRSKDNSEISIKCPVVTVN